MKYGERAPWTKVIFGRIRKLGIYWLESLFRVFLDAYLFINLFYLFNIDENNYKHSKYNIIIYLFGRECCWYAKSYGNLFEFEAYVQSNHTSSE